MRGPRHFSKSELKRVGIELIDEHTGAVRCMECGKVW